MITLRFILITSQNKIRYQNMVLLYIYFYFHWIEFTVRGHNTSPASFDHEIVIYVFLSLQDKVKNLKLKYEAIVKQKVELAK